MRYKPFLIMLILLAQGCTSPALVYKETVTSSPTATAIATAEEGALPVATATNRAEPLRPIPVLYKGVFTLEVKIVDENTSSGLDFDANSSTTMNGADIRLLVSKGQFIFLTIMPINGASGYSLEKKEIGAVYTFNYNDCLTKLPNYQTGSTPIGVGELFCWKSNEGRLVEFAILSAKGTGDGEVRVEIDYIVWDKIVE